MSGTPDGDLRNRRSPEPLNIEPKFNDGSNHPFSLVFTSHHPRLSPINSPNGNDTIWTSHLPMYDGSVDLGSDHLNFILLSVELDDKAMMSIKVRGDRRNVVPATRPIVVPMPTEGDRHCAARRSLIGSWFEPNAVLAAMVESTLSNLEMLYTLNRKCITSPSTTMYSLPSMRILPADFTAASEPRSTRSFQWVTSALMKPRWKSV